MELNDSNYSKWFSLMQKIKLTIHCKMISLILPHMLNKRNLWIPPSTLNSLGECLLTVIIFWQPAPSTVRWTHHWLQWLNVAAVGLTVLHLVLRFLDWRMFSRKVPTENPQVSNFQQFQPIFHPAPKIFRLKDVRQEGAVRAPHGSNCSQFIRNQTKCVQCMAGLSLALQISTNSLDLIRR